MHMIRRAGKVAAAAALLSVLAGCSEPLRPHDFAGTYALLSIGGDPLPAVLFESPAEALYVISEQLDIEGASGATIVREMESRRPTSPVQRFTASNRYTVRVEDDHLVLDLFCPLNAICPAILQSYRAYREPEGGLRLEGVTSRGPMRYTRASAN
jgi:hypothetical protein